MAIILSPKEQALYSLAQIAALNALDAGISPAVFAGQYQGRDRDVVEAAIAEKMRLESRRARTAVSFAMRGLPRAANDNPQGGV